MQYLLQMPDGKEYGPTDVNGLRQWAAENRLKPDDRIRDVLSAQTLFAREIQGVFSGPVAPYRPTPSSNIESADFGPLLGVLWRSAAGIVLFFWLHGLGLIFAGYALFYAIRAQMDGNKYGIVAILIATASLAAVGVGWMMRLSGKAV